MLIDAPLTSKRTPLTVIAVAVFLTSVPVTTVALAGVTEPVVVPLLPPPHALSAATANPATAYPSRFHMVLLLVDRVAGPCPASAISFGFRRLPRPALRQ